MASYETAFLFLFQTIQPFRSRSVEPSQSITKLNLSSSSTDLIQSHSLRPTNSLPGLPLVSPTKPPLNGTAALPNSAAPVLPSSLPNDGNSGQCTPLM